jgi:exo-1,4-beta-D-glucosaminidase
VADYARKAQAMTYDGQRAMFEGYARNKYTATGVIQWMLNNAWPSLIWHLYDWYLRPGGGYFGTKQACEPLHAQFSYDDRGVVVVNDTPQEAKGLKLRAEIFDLAARSLHLHEAVVDVPADGLTRALTLPRPEGVSGAYLVRLDLKDGAGRALGTNVYWLSTREDELDWANPKWYFTPTRVHADLTALERLPPTRLAVAARFEPGGAEESARVTVTNRGPALAFQVRLKLVDAVSGEEPLPVFWDDNYLTLWPGETRELSVSLPRRAGRRLAVTAEAWNAPEAR